MIFKAGRTFDSCLGRHAFERGMRSPYLTVIFNPDDTVKDRIAIINPTGGMTRDR